MTKKTINQHLHDIEKVFQYGFARGQSKKLASKSKQKARTYSKNTTRNDLQKVKMFAKFIYQQFGVTDARFYRTEHGQAWVSYLLERFQRDEIAAGSVKTYIHAVAKYQNILRDQQGFRARVINSELELDRAKEHGVVRRLEYAKKGRIINHQEALNMAIALGKSRSINAKVIGEITLFQLYTGSRITAALRFQVKDADVKNHSVTFIDDKGGKTRTVKDIDSDYMEHLKMLIEGKNAGRQVFELRNPDEGLKAIETARKSIESLYARVTAKLGLEGANTHSQRKAFANDRYAVYLSIPEQEARHELARRAKESSQLAAKIRKMGGVYGSNPMSSRNVARMLVSIDLGHERMDVLRFYLLK